MKRLLINLFLLACLSLASAQTYVELILDASGSMWNTLDDGRYRIIAAKDVLSQFIGGLADDGLNVGLRIYGSQTDALEEGACQDSSLFVPLSGIDKSAMLQQVQDADARGATPIAYSLLEAGNDFPADAQKRLIVLVTDGEESCGGNLKAVAEDLKARGIEVDIRIIGFDLDEKAIKSFEGVGTFENATSAEALARALTTALEDVVEEEAADTSCEEEASLSAPESALASYPFEVAFSGPEGFISIHPVDGDEFSALATFFTLWGNPAELTAPSEAGTYELRYTSTLSRCVLVKTDLFIEASTAHLSLPESVEAGFKFQMPFEGPEGSFGIYPDSSASKDNPLTYSYSIWGNPAEMTAPSQTGNYEVRYYDVNGGLLTTSSLNVTESQAQITVPPRIEAGFTFDMPFNGPEGLFTIYQNGNQLDIPNVYTLWGNPARIQAPSETGSYELYYVDNNGTTIARASFEVTASTASITVPETVEAGYSFDMPYAGPEGQFGIYRQGVTDKNDALAYSYTVWGNPTQLGAPIEQGSYDVRYYDANGTILASGSITVTPSLASLNGPNEVNANSRFQVPFNGPEGLIGIFQVSAPDDVNASLVSHYVVWGNPAELTAPAQAGTYEIRYYAMPVNGQAGMLVSAPLIVK
ncbi:MAG: VWA domain-containing protein [Trueperaceae bacterium]|nr:VWA domain-containing protein [Trueperaceae bacterium]